MSTSIPRYSADRIACCNNSAARELLQTVNVKQSNLCVAADVTTSGELLHLIEQVGEHICLLKTHIDIISDFDPSLIDQLLYLKKKHRFLIFEDRKFADIGNTVRLQYGEGIYRIAQWADLINAHLVPGPGIIEGLREVGLQKGAGLLLLGEMSSKGHLAQGAYTQKAVDWSRLYDDFVCGWIAQHALTDDDGMITLTPGIHLEQAGDHLQQAYVTPQAALDKGSDILIVGRGIYQADDPKVTAGQYRQIAWDYLSKNS